MQKKIDPLNSKHYGAITAMLTVADIESAARFYQEAFGFTMRGTPMKGPDGKAMHAELTLRGNTLMLGPILNAVCAAPKHSAARLYRCTSQWRTSTK